MLNLIQLYKQLFYKSLFFDKYSVKNIYQCPKIDFLKLKFFSSAYSNLNKVQFCKFILLFYVLTGQRPKLIIQQCSIRNISRKKIVGLSLVLHNYHYFFNFLTHRQIAHSALIWQGLPNACKSTFTFQISQKVQDDDILFQSLKISDWIKYHITVTSTAVMRCHLRSLLITFKIPCKNNSN